MRWRILSIIGTLFLVAILGYWHLEYNFQTLPDAWIDIPNIPTNVGLSRLIWDIRLPEVRSISAKVKFITARTGQYQKAELAYNISIDVDTLDVSQIPEKYRMPRPVGKTGAWAWPPVDHVIYEITVDFILLDKDGFQLAHLEGPKET